MKITRRDLAVLATAAPAALLVGNAQPQGVTDVELEMKRQQNRAAAQVVAAIELPVSTEPAFEFKA